MIWVVESFTKEGQDISRSFFDGNEVMIKQSVAITFCMEPIQPMVMKPDAPGQLKWLHGPTGETIIAYKAPIRTQADHL